MPARLDCACQSAGISGRVRRWRVRQSCENTGETMAQAQKRRRTSSDQASRRDEKGPNQPTCDPASTSNFDLRPSGYDADQKENIWSLDFNHLYAKPLISLDYLAALTRSRRKGQWPKP